MYLNILEWHTYQNETPNIVLRTVLLIIQIILLYCVIYLSCKIMSYASFETFSNGWEKSVNIENSSKFNGDFFVLSCFRQTKIKPVYDPYQHTAPCGWGLSLIIESTGHSCVIVRGDWMGSSLSSSRWGGFDPWFCFEVCNTRGKSK
jgi:hypothetical protein